MLWDAEQMMDEAVLQISKRYNLTPQQEEYTRLYLKMRVREFLDQYETDVRELLQESIDMRLGRKGGDPNVMVQWAVRAAPVYEAAKKAILDGNNEWGQILDEEQKKIHTTDLRLMETNFTNVTRQLKDWQEGKGQPIFDAQTGRAGGGVSNNPPQIMRKPEIEDQWVAYVEKFISAYKLDDAKKIAAREKIHKDQLEKAKQYREANKDKFRQVEDEKKAVTSEMSPEERAKRILDADRKKNDLEMPVRRLFIEMCRRLESLPSSKQRSEVSETDRKALEDLHRRLAGDPVKNIPDSQSGGPSKVAPDSEKKQDAEVAPTPETQTPAPATQPTENPGTTEKAEPTKD